MSTFNPLLSPDMLYEIFSTLDYPSIMNHCRTNKQIRHLCQTNPNIINLKIRKFIEYELSLNGNDINKLFFKCIENNYIVILKYLITVKNFDPSIDNNRALILACEKSNYAIVDFLLKDNRVNPLAQNKKALSICVSNGKLNILELFFSAVKLDTETLNEIFIQACKEHKVNIVNAMLKFKDLDVSRGLYIACNSSDTSLFNILFPIADISVYYDVCLVTVSLNGNLDIFNKLIFDKRIIPSENLILDLFINACKQGNYEIAIILLNNFKFNPGDLDQAALYYAVENNKVDIVKLLLTLEGIDPAINNQDIFNGACINGQYEIVELFLSDNRIDPLYEDCKALQLACRYGHKNVIMLFLSKNLAICYDKCLMTAIKFGYYNLISLFVANVDKLTLDNALKETCKMGKYESTELLLDYGANPTVDNNICFIYACQSNNLKIVLSLLNYPIDPTVDNYKALEIVVEKNNYNIFDVLLSDSRIKTVPEYIVDKIIKFQRLDFFNRLLQKGVNNIYELLYKAVTFNATLIVNKLLDFNFTEEQISYLLNITNNDDIAALLNDYLTKTVI
ncbi:MAG: ankyrin repeat domain-containing protein [Candidatus Micrarchaeaceae archaeon]